MAALVRCTRSPSRDEAARDVSVYGEIGGLGASESLGEYDFSEDKLQDSVGIKPPKLTD
jgi:hypothetical protein